MSIPVPVVGFISPPAWFDPAPSEFPSVCHEVVRTQQAPLRPPSFDYRLESIAGVQDELDNCARVLRGTGSELVAQVGSPFAWAGAESEVDARARSERLAVAAGAPAVMTGLAIVDGLRALEANRIAVTCTYYDRAWRDSFSQFMTLCGFDVLAASTLADQGLVEPNAGMAEYGWSMMPDLTRRSILAVAAAEPGADAIVVTGSGTRTLDLLNGLEAEAGRPIVAADTVLYWAVARELGLTLRPVLGRLATVNPG